MVAFSLIFSGSLLISYSAPYINPESFWLPAFWGLAYPYLLVINLLFLLYWLFRRKWSFLIPLFVIAVGYGNIKNFIQLNRSKISNSEDCTIKLMTYNVRAFDKYEWSKDPDTKTKMLQLLKEQNADIYCFQEFYYTRTGKLSLYNLKKLTNCKYMFLGEKKNGVAIFSKYPIIKKGEIVFENGNFCNAIYVDIKVDNKIIRVYNLHLESNRLGGRNYAFIKKRDFKADEKELEEIKDISFRLQHAFVKRAQQAQVIRRHIEKSPYPTLVCGDFNDTAFSYTYREIKSNLTDCFRERGSGIGTTYSGDFPSFRIDFVLHDEQFVCNKYKRIKRNYSDHFPIYTELSLVKK